MSVSITTKKPIKYLQIHYHLGRAWLIFWLIDSRKPNGIKASEVREFLAEIGWKIKYFFRWPPELPIIPQLERFVDFGFMDAELLTNGDKLFKTNAEGRSTFKKLNDKIDFETQLMPELGMRWSEIPM